MSMLGILDRITQRKKQNTLSAGEAYYQLVRSVASGEETDIDQAADIIEAANKTEENFQADVSTMQQRYEWHRQYLQFGKLQSEFAKIEQERDRLVRDLQAAMDKYQPAIGAASDKLRGLETQITIASDAEGRLRASCFDQSILARESELLAKRTELQQQRRPLFDDLTVAKARIATCQSAVTGVPRIRNHKDLHQEWITEQERNESIVVQLQAAVDVIDAKLRPINVELFEIRKAKLTP